MWKYILLLLFIKIFMQNLVRKWRGNGANFFRATATVPLFFTLVPPRRAPAFLVRASGAVALVPSTGLIWTTSACEGVGRQWRGSPLLLYNPFQNSFVKK